MTLEKQVHALGQHSAIHRSPARLVGGEIRISAPARTGAAAAAAAARTPSPSSSPGSQAATDATRKQQEIRCEIPD